MNTTYLERDPDQKIILVLIMPQKKSKHFFTHTLQDLTKSLQIHRSTVYRLINSGQIRQGTHYIDLRQPTGQRGILRFDLEAVQGTMSRNRK